MTKRWMGVLAVGLLLTGCTQERPKGAAPAPAASFVAPAMWDVKDADTTIHLFGTVHVMKPGVEWFGGPVKAAFDGSDELVLEIIEPEDPQAMAGLMTQAAIARDGVKLSDRLSPEAQGKYVAAMQANGLPAASFEMFEPWMAGMMLSVAPLEKLGYKAELGAEKTLGAAAKASGKKIGALETIEQQIGYFDTLPMAQQVEFLNATVDGLPDMEVEFAKLVDHWKAGDPDALAKAMNESLEATPELAKVLLGDRNARWAEWIRERLKTPGTVFVAVGAGHLAGTDSVQDKLKALGISAERVRK